MDPARQRLARETYWKIRRSALCVRYWLAMWWPGSKEEEEYQRLWLTAEVIDGELAAAHSYGGYPAMEYALSTSDTLEHLLSELASVQAMRVSGDSRLAAALTTTKAPGQDHIAPLWAVTAANDIAKAQYSQHIRVLTEKAGAQGRRGSPNVVVVIDEHGNTTGGDTAAKEPVRRRPRRPKAGKVEGKGNTGSPPKHP